MLHQNSSSCLSPRERDINCSAYELIHSREAVLTYSSRVRLQLKGTMREEHIAVLGQFCAKIITNFSQLQYTPTLTIHIVLNNKTLTLTSQGYAQCKTRESL